MRESYNSSTNDCKSFSDSAILSSLSNKLPTIIKHFCEWSLHISLKNHLEDYIMFDINMTANSNLFDNFNIYFLMLFSLKSTRNECFFFFSEKK